MKATKEMLIDAIIGKGLTGDVNQRNQESDMFTRLGLGKEEIAENPITKECVYLGFKFYRNSLNELTLKDLTFLYNREYQKQVDPKIIVSSIIPQSKRAE